MLAKIFPFLLWFKDYSGGKFRTDAIAGITVAMVLIPQSMAYAQLAGLPAYYGLYAAFLPPMVAALFGSSRQLATGPVAVVSLMSAASLEPLATAGGPQFIAYSIVLALMVGSFQLFLGVFRLGLVVNLLSHPVVNGFTNAAAIVIASSQFSKLFGVYVDKAPHHYQTIINVCKSASHYTHYPTLLMGGLAIAIMVGLKRVNPKIPNVLVAVAVTTILSVVFNFNNDKIVSIADIKDPAAVQLITDFNSDVAKSEALGTKRAELNKSLKTEVEASKKSGANFPSEKELSIKHQMAVVQTNIDESKFAAHEKREKLRMIHFSLAENSNETLEFYTPDTLQDGVKTDGRKWRIKIGNKEIPFERKTDEKGKTVGIKMMGAGAVVGDIPSGLSMAVPKKPEGVSVMDVISQLWMAAIIISLLGFMEAIAIAKSMAAKTGQKLDPNQELIGQGLANIIGAFGKSYSVSGSFSRSAVNLGANAVSGVSSVVTSIMVGITLLFLTPFLYHLPQAVLASVIMMAVIGLINKDGFVHAWKAKRSDGAISVITFVCTLYFAPYLEEGIMIGVALTFAVFIYKNLRPRVALLSKSQDDSLKSAEKYGLKECDHIAVVRFDGSLIFTNASYLEDKVLEFIAEKPDLRHVLVEASGINDVDASGEDALSILIDSLREAGRDISFSGVKEEVYEVLQRTHLLDKIGTDHFYATGEKALKSIYQQIHDKGQCSGCPLSNYIPIMDQVK